ncbi:helix-turn-helix domain-containing protein [Flexivirga alba]|uniref:Helix-turn-helix domain-containing protein n=1 Tax=Flexivirga alba TaxID=702742 RepID=A0ABW2AL33_9MICO
MAREVRVALSRMREVARQLGDRRREVTVSACVSAGGNAEVVGSGSSPDSSTVGLSSGEVASRLRVSTRRVRQLCTAGALEAIRVGGAWRITESSVDDYLDELEVAG